MSRRRRAEQREIKPDSKYSSTLLSVFIKKLMLKGKLSKAEKIMYDAIEIIKRKTEQDGVAVFKKALGNVRPVLEVKSRRIGGANYQIPIEVDADRRNALAIRWLIDASRSKSGIPMAERLAGELISAFNNEGAAVKKKEETHRMAEANKAFAHFRFK